MRRGSLLPAASAAAALASLHHHRAEYDWDSDPVSSRLEGLRYPQAADTLTPNLQDAVSEPDSKSYRPRARFAPTTTEHHITTTEEPYYTATSLQRELLPSSLTRSPPGRSSTLPPAPRSIKPNRPRKSSVGQNARKPKHERQKSRDNPRRMSYDRKAFSAEPQTAAALFGKRWEDLIDAAASATEEDSRDLTPVGPPLYTLIFVKANSLPGASLSSHVQPELASSLHCLSVSFLHSIALAEHIDTSTSGHVGYAPVSIR